MAGQDRAPGNGDSRCEQAQHEQTRLDMPVRSQRFVVRLQRDYRRCIRVAKLGRKRRISLVCNPDLPRPVSYSVLCMPIATRSRGYGRPTKGGTKNASIQDDDLRVSAVAQGMR